MGFGGCGRCASVLGADLVGRCGGVGLPQHRICLVWYGLVALDALGLGWWAGVIDAVAVSSQLLLVVVSGLGTLGLPMVVVPVAVAVQSLVLVGAVANWVSRVLADWV